MYAYVCWVSTTSAQRLFKRLHSRLQLIHLFSSWHKLADSTPPLPQTLICSFWCLCLQRIWRLWLSRVFCRYNSSFCAWFQWGRALHNRKLFRASTAEWVGVCVCVCERISCVYVRCKVNYTGKWIQHSLHVTRRQSTNFYRHRPAIWRPSTTVCLLRLGRCICVRVCGYTGGVCVWKSVCINFITTTQHSTAQYSTVKQFPSRTLPQHKILCEARLRLLSSSENLHVIRTEFLRVLRK